MRDNDQGQHFDPSLYRRDDDGVIRYQINDTRMNRLNIPQVFRHKKIFTTLDEDLGQHFSTFKVSGMPEKSIYFIGDLMTSGALLARVAKFYGSFIGLSVLFTTMGEISRAISEDESVIRMYSSLDILCVNNFGNELFDDFNKTINGFSRIINQRFYSAKLTYFSSDKTLKELNDEGYLTSIDLKMIHHSTVQKIVEERS